MGQATLSFCNKRRSLAVAGRRGRPLGRSGLALLIIIGAGIIGLFPTAAQAQHCRMRYGEAFQLISTQSLIGRSAAGIKQTVDNLFGPRQDVCSEAGYKFFLGELGTQAAAAFRKKGPEQEARLLATREILTRFPLQVRFNAGSDASAGIVQLRSNLAVLSQEVGVTPAIQDLLAVLAKVTPPKSLTRPLPVTDDVIPVTVPKVPLPAWAIVSLYEIRDHAQHNENGSVINKTNLILDWVARVNAGIDPADIHVVPAPAAGTPAKPVPPTAR